MAARPLRILRVFALLLAFAFACAAVPAGAYALPVGSLTLRCASGTGDDAVAVGGDVFAITRIADARADAAAPAGIAFDTLPAYANADRDWAALNSSQLHDAALELADMAGDADRTARANGYGWVRFSSLAAGMYLVQRTEVAQGNEGYTCDPFLVFIPEAVDGSAVYDMTAYPKFGTVAPTPPDGGEPGTPDDSPTIWDTILDALPQTGDSRWMLLALLLCIAGTFVLVISHHRTRVRAHEDESSTE